MSQAVHVQHFLLDCCGPQNHQRKFQFTLWIAHLLFGLVGAAGPASAASKCGRASICRCLSSSWHRSSFVRWLALTMASASWIQQFLCLCQAVVLHYLATGWKLVRKNTTLQYVPAVVVENVLGAAAWLPLHPHWCAECLAALPMHAGLLVA